MLKYLPVENATLELNISSKKKYRYFLKKYINEIENHCFKRILINIKENQLEDYVNITNELINNKSFLIIFNTFLKSVPKINLKDNYIIYNKNYKNIIKNNKIYNVISSNNTQLIIENINNGINVIIKPIININKITKFNKNINKIVSNITSNEVFLGGYVLPTHLVKEHPCNFYLCRGKTCHQNMTGLPREVYIDNNYTGYPHGLKFKKLCMGELNNISLQEFFNNYLESDEYNLFIKYNKKIFLNIIRNYPYDYVPLVEYLKNEVKNNE